MLSDVYSNGQLEQAGRHVVQAIDPEGVKVYVYLLSKQPRSVKRLAKNKGNRGSRLRGCGAGSVCPTFPSIIFF